MLLVQQQRAAAPEPAGLNTPTRRERRPRRHVSTPIHCPSSPSASIPCTRCFHGTSPDARHGSTYPFHDETNPGVLTFSDTTAETRWPGGAPSPPPPSRHGIRSHRDRPGNSEASRGCMTRSASLPVRRDATPSPNLEASCSLPWKRSRFGTPTPHDLITPASPYDDPVRFCSFTPHQKRLLKRGCSVHICTAC